MPPTNKPAYKSGEHVLPPEQAPVLAQAIARAVADAITTQLPLLVDQLRDETDDNKGIKALKVSLEGLHVELKNQTVGINQRFDRVQQQLSEGATKFAVHEQRLDQFGERIQTIEQRRYDRGGVYERGGTTDLQRALRPLKEKDAPLISPKVWNILFIAAIGAVGTGVGTYLVDMVRAGQHAGTQSPAALPAASGHTP